jgi:hypothetical protein
VDRQEDRLRAVVRRSPLILAVLDGWAEIGLPDCWLVAGSVAQTVWNDAFGLRPTYGTSDIDLVYFDAADLSEETEARHAARIRSLFSGLGVWLDVKNEARVHLWYAMKFGNLCLDRGCHHDVSDDRNGHRPAAALGRAACLFALRTVGLA